MDEIFDYLKQSSPNGQELSIKAQRKEILKATWVSKKAKFINNFNITEVAWITILRD